VALPLGSRPVSSPVAAATPDRAVVAILLGLTVVTGLVDAFSFLLLGRVFVANMTGNVVFLAFAVAGAADFQVAPSLVALAAFAIGAFVGGRLASGYRDERFALLARVAGLEALLFAGAVGVNLAVGPAVPVGQYLLIALLAPAMGIQNAAARALAVPDLTTTVLTMTVTGLFADGRQGLRNGAVGRRVASLLAMFAGAVIGSLLLVGAGGTAVVVAGAIGLGVIALVAATRSDGPRTGISGRSPQDLHPPGASSP
jgi:uncharacterized membrane protein YoaK (UPF0700 family)